MDQLQNTPGVPLSLQGTVALVTGGSRGIGAATVRLFRQAGARVAFSYRSAEAQAKALEAECGGPAECRGIQQDLFKPADGEALVSATENAFGSLDSLVVNHGIWPPHDQPVGSMTDEQWRGTMGTNLDSVFGLVRAAASRMQRAQPRDGAARHIVLVSSTAGQRGEAFHADYAASKGALISMTKGLATELAADRIHVNCVAPGWVRTDMSERTLNDPAASNRVFRTIPLGRVATPEEIEAALLLRALPREPNPPELSLYRLTHMVQGAGPILFLCTPWAGFITGEVFNVNGGAVLVG